MTLPPEFHLQIIRKECNDEQTLISHRMTWTLMIEAFLFTTFAITLGNGSIKAYWWFTFLFVPAIGCAVAIYAKEPIRAAIETIKFWHSKEDEFFDNHPDFKPLSRKGRGDHLHWQSMRYPQNVPNLLIFIWTTLGILGLLQTWMKIFPQIP